MWYALFGSTLFNGLALALVLWLVVSGVGEQWIGSLGFMATNHSSDLGVQAGINFLGSILGGNIVIQLIIFLGFVAWALNGTPASELQATRYMLAASLDRMIPSALGEVDERTHSPRNAIILCTIAGELSILGLIAIPQASLLGALMAQIIAVVTCFAWNFIVAGLVFKVIGKFLGSNRVSAEVEVAGLDVPEMGLPGYPEFITATTPEEVAAASGQAMAGKVGSAALST